MRTVIKAIGLGPLHMSLIDRADLVCGNNFALGSYDKADITILWMSSGAIFDKISKHGEKQKL